MRRPVAIGTNDGLSRDLWAFWELDPWRTEIAANHGKICLLAIGARKKAAEGGTEPILTARACLATCCLACGENVN